MRLILLSPYFNSLFLNHTYLSSTVLFLIFLNDALFSVPLSMDTILQEVRGRPEGLEMTLEHVRADLNQLGCVPSLAGTEGLYSIGMIHFVHFSSAHHKQ